MIEEIQETIKILRKGGTILYPTDTIWGIGCDATNAHAVEKVYQLKRRNESKSFIILLDDVARLEKYVEKVFPIALDLIQQYTKPLTIIYPNAKNLAKGVAAEDHSIGIRVTRDPFCKSLIKTFGKPLVSTSANISGQETPYSFDKVSEKIKKNVNYIVPLRWNEVAGQIHPSTIIKMQEDGTFTLVRDF